MNIDLDIISEQDRSGLNRVYDVVLHWETNEHDDLDPLVLRKMKTEVESLVSRRLNEAINKGTTYSKVKELDGGLEPTTQPYEVNIYTDYANKEVVVTKRYRGV